MSQYLIKTARWLHKQRPGVRFIAPMASFMIQAHFKQCLKDFGNGLSITLFDGQSHDVMAAADTILLASGTAALEAMLLKKPMVVAYRVSKLTEFIAKRLLTVDMYSLPNHLAGKRIVQEFVQEEVKASNLGPALLEFLQNKEAATRLQGLFTEIHQQLKLNASEQAAKAVLELVGRRV